MTTATAKVTNGIQTQTVQSTLQYVGTATVIGAGYAVMEVINHVVLFGYLQTWLVSMGLSATVISVILYTLLVATIGLVAYLAWKFYVSKRTVQ